MRARIGTSSMERGFTSGADKLVIGIALTNLPGTGVLANGRFALGTAADAGDRFIFDAGNGNLYYDADGNGAGAQLHVATLSSGSLAASDIVIA